MEPIHLYILFGIIMVGILYLVWRKRKSKRDTYVVSGKIVTTLVFGVLGLLFAIWIAFKLSSSSRGEYAVLDLAFALILSVPIGVILGPIFGMTLFKIISKLLSRKKNEKK